MDVFLYSSHVAIFALVYDSPRHLFLPVVIPVNMLTAWQVMVAEALDIERETYLAFLMDRTCSGPVVVGSPMGGMDIEEVAKKHPDAIHKVCQQ